MIQKRVGKFNRLFVYALVFVVVFSILSLFVVFAASSNGKLATPGVFHNINELVDSTGQTLGFKLQLLAGLIQQNNRGIEQLRQKNSELEAQNTLLNEKIKTVVQLIGRDRELQFNALYNFELTGSAGRKTNNLGLPDNTIRVRVEAVSNLRISSCQLFYKNYNAWSDFGSGNSERNDENYQRGEKFVTWEDYDPEMFAIAILDLDALPPAVPNTEEYTIKIRCKPQNSNVWKPSDDGLALKLIGV